MGSFCKKLLVKAPSLVLQGPGVWQVGQQQLPEVGLRQGSIWYVLIGHFHRLRRIHAENQGRISFKRNQFLFVDLFLPHFILWNFYFCVALFLK